MVIAIKFKVDDKLVRDRLGRIMTQVPEFMEREAAQFSHDVAKEIQRSIIRNKLVWRGDLLRSVRSLKLKKGSYGVSMRKYGVHLDRGEPHYRSLKRGRKITQWARQSRKGIFRKSGLSSVHRKYKGGPLSFSSGDTAGVIHVTPTPFIKEPVQAMARSMRGRFATALKRGMQ